jgi:hypothetical protein
MSCRLKDPCQHRHKTQMENDYSDSDSGQYYTSCCRAMDRHLFGTLNLSLHIDECVHFEGVTRRSMQAKVADRRTLDLGSFSLLAIALSRTFRVLEIHAADGYSHVAAPVLHFELLDTSPAVAKRRTRG